MGLGVVLPMGKLRQETGSLGYILRLCLKKLKDKMVNFMICKFYENLKRERERETTWLCHLRHSHHLQASVSDKGRPIKSEWDSRRGSVCSDHLAPSSVT
jgi:hypothetical protein